MTTHPNSTTLALTGQSIRETASSVTSAVARMLAHTHAAFMPNPKWQHLALPFGSFLLCRWQGICTPGKPLTRRPGKGAYRLVRRCQSSGNSSTSSMRRRYCTPEVPPVPRLNPMTRSTVVTWLNRQRRKQSSKSTSFSASS